MIDPLLTWVKITSAAYATDPRLRAWMREREKLIFNAMDAANAALDAASPPPAAPRSAPRSASAPSSPRTQTSTKEVVTYKGRQYNLLFKGQTKFGYKAKLAFLDGSKEFWVDASEISGSGARRTSGTSRGRSQRYICDECEEWVTPGTSCWETGMRH